MNIEETIGSIEFLKDEAKFDDLFCKYRNKLYITAFMLLSNPQDAEDAVQETALLAFSSIKKLRDSSLFKTWVTRILINVCKGMRLTRNKKKTVPLHDNLWTNPLDNDETDLLRAIRLMNKNDRVIITLRFFHDLKLIEIAQILKVSENTVKSRLYRAIGKLKKIYKKE